ncbi:MAG: DUF4382 domain-containing protein [Bacteroidales bacterium]
MQKIKNICQLIILSTLMIATGCKKEKEPYARIQLYLKDSPADFDSLLIRIFSIELISDSSRYSEKITVKQAKPINILQYTNEKDTLLGEFFFNAPSLERITITFGSSHTLYRKNKSIAINLKDSIYTLLLNKAIVLKNAELNKLYLDFDCYFSLQKRKDTWELNPVVKLRTADSTGSVRGKVKTLGKMPFVWLISTSDTLSTLPQKDGFFHILYVPPGKYSLWLLISEDEEDATPTKIIEEIQVEPSKVTGVGTLLIN